MFFGAGSSHFYTKDGRIQGSKSIFNIVISRRDGVANDLNPSRHLLGKIVGNPARAGVLENRGVAQLVAYSHGVRAVGSSSLPTPTRNESVVATFSRAPRSDRDETAAKL